MDPAVMTGAVLVAIGAIAAFAIKRAANTQRILPTTDSPCWRRALAPLAGAHNLAITSTRTTKNHPKSKKLQRTPLSSAAGDPAASAA
jgi:hypothetical protein